MVIGFLGATIPSAAQWWDFWTGVIKYLQRLLQPNALHEVELDILQWNSQYFVQTCSEMKLLVKFMLYVVVLTILISYSPIYSLYRSPESVPQALMQTFNGLFWNAFLFKNIDTFMWWRTWKNLEKSLLFNMYRLLSAWKCPPTKEGTV